MRTSLGARRANSTGAFIRSVRDNQCMPTFTDERGHEISYYEWLVPEPKAVVQILHGVGEHAGRYEHVAAALNQAGYSVYADDHLGHGLTGMAQWGGDRAKLGKLGPGGLRAAENAIEMLTAIIRQENPGIPLVLLGHSWGSLMAQRIINREPKAYEAVVLSGSAYRMPGSMEGGDLNKAHKHLGDTGFEWLSRDLDVARAFVADELAFGGKVIDLFGPIEAVKLFGLPSKHLPAKLPLYIVSGSDDPLSIGHSVTKLGDAYRKRSGMTDVTVKIYQGARHEVFNETNKAEVLGDLVTWLDTHFAK